MERAMTVDRAAVMTAARRDTITADRARATVTNSFSGDKGPLVL